MGLWKQVSRRWGRVGAIAVIALLCLKLLACTSLGNSTGKPPVEVTLAAFVVTRTVHEQLIPKFVAQWQREHQQQVTFSRSYGGSGSQTRAVVDGLDADVVHLALALDTERLQKAGLIQPGWEREFPDQSIVSKSVVALVTRPGNPKQIRDWSDLAKPGITLVTADPKTSGVARWNFLALWNGAIQAGADTAQATEFMRNVYNNVPALTRDAREATDVFSKQERIDALINYENEVILSAQKGMPLNYTIPRVNISIDNPIAIVDRNVQKHGNREVAEAYVRYLYTPEAQTVFAQLGFRPVDAQVAQQFASQFPHVEKLATAQTYGGWQKIQKRFFADGAIFDQIRTQIGK
ncbi:sulfate ABC transporter substrate-binding protein [Neosynechococcus sphagnicola]|uniref:sulfate ABC transporter substrate-binding protein n=1 Tax=Neosynechococcus sphagnicola TaxID=1501145 RepID=UPI0006894F75|nr:sulfate ABC transporter substrate-binding protein [Neosynechococcus sphagnicola]